jgi:hypothetical protein
MKPFEYYSKLQVSYPNRMDYITLYVYDKGILLWSGPHYKKSKADLKEEYPNAIIQEVLDNDSYLKHRDEYAKEKNRLHEEFKSDLYADFGVSDNPKRDKAFKLAWEHAPALGDVYDYFADLVVLIKD